MRVVSWNVDGVAPILEALLEIAAELGAPDVLCLQELRVRAHDAEGVARLDALPGYVGGYSLNRDPHNAKFRGGRTYGVGTWVKKGLRARHRTLPWDREGRVVVTELDGLVVFNVYAVNGTAKAYFDPDSGAPVGTRFDFKRAFQRVLASEMAPVRDHAIAIGDFNVSQAKIDTHPRLRTEEPHTRAREELANAITELDLVDAFRALHPEARAYTWFNRRARKLDAARVDFALVAKALMPRVVAADVLPLRTESDHAPIVLELR